LPFAYAEHRAVLPRGWYDHLWHPLQFLFGQWFFLLPSLAIATPLFLPRRPDRSPLIPAQAGIQGQNRVAGEGGSGSPLSRGRADHGSDAFDYRIVSWLAFGPMAAVLAMSAVSGRGTVAMWGYPLWLFLGLWLVLSARNALDRQRLARILAIWGIVFAGLALAFFANYDLLPRFDHRYRAVFYPGGALGRDIEARFRTATGAAPVYVIGTMWDGGNVEHYAPSHPRNLVDGEPARAPWIDLADLKRRGAVLVWTDSDPARLPEKFAGIAAGAVVQPPFTLAYRRGPGEVRVGWAILKPQA